MEIVQSKTLNQKLVPVDTQMVALPKVNFIYHWH